jgi:hypothetical protein
MLYYIVATREFCEIEKAAWVKCSKMPWQNYFVEFHVPFRGDNMVLWSCEAMLIMAKQLVLINNKSR